MNQFLSQENQFVTEYVGRKKGVPNKIPRAVKEAILLAAEHVGRKNHSNHPFDGLVSFLEDIALQHPAVFIQLLARLLPLEISGECPDSVQPSVQINLHGR